MGPTILTLFMDFPRFLWSNATTGFKMGNWFLSHSIQSHVQ